MINRCFRPHCPLAEEAACKANSISTKIKFSQKIEKNVVVISCVERDFSSTPGFGYGASDIERVIAVERSNLDCDQVFNFRQPAPEFVGQNTTSNAALQVKPHDGDD